MTSVGPLKPTTKVVGILKELMALHKLTDQIPIRQQRSCFFSVQMASEFTFSVSSQTLSPRMMRAPEYPSDNSLLSSVNHLDSLVSFYQNERMWVYRTRAKLQDAFTPQITTEQPGS